MYAMSTFNSFWFNPEQYIINTLLLEKYHSSVFLYSFLQKIDIAKVYMVMFSMMEQRELGD